MNKAIIILEDVYMMETISNALKDKFEVVNFTNDTLQLSNLKDHIATTDLIVYDYDMIFKNDKRILEFLDEKDSNIQTIVLVNDIDNVSLSKDENICIISKLISNKELFNKISALANEYILYVNSVITNFDLLDVPNAFVVVVDYDTKEIIYKNKLFCELFPNDKLTKCYERLLHSDKKCLNCPFKSFNWIYSEQFKEWSIFNNKLNKRFDLNGKFAVYNDKKVIVLYGTDVSCIDEKRKEVEYSKQAQDILLASTSHLINIVNYETSINNTIKLLCDFFDADRSYIFERSGEIFNNKFEYCKNGIIPAIKSHQNVAHEVLHVIDEAVKSKSSFIVDTNDVKNKDKKAELKSKGIEKIIIVPLFQGDTYTGFIGIDNFRTPYVEAVKSTLETFSKILSTFYRVQNRLESLNRDSLTKLMTFNLFEHEVEKNVLANSNKVMSIVKFDVHNFKYFNHYYSNEYGDQVLINIANTLEKHTDFVKAACRRPYSDIFFFLAAGSAEVVKNKIPEIFSTAIIEEQAMNCTFNYGVYEIQDSKEAFSSMIAKVSLAQKRARTLGLNAIVIYEEEFFNESNIEQRVINNFDLSIKNKDFKLYIQPKYDQKNTGFYAGEVLVRWTFNNKIVSPGVFIPILENNGLIAKLDQYILKETVLLIRRWIDEGRKVCPLSINFSRVSFYNKFIFEDMIKVIDEYKIPHKFIEIEITESAFIDCEENICDFIKKCKQVGINVLMDDFGSRESSLNSLRKFDVSKVKLDYKFLLKDTFEDRGTKIIKGIVSLVRGLGLPLIVEGVEEEEHIQLFEELGVRFIQGYYYSKPLPIEEFEKLDLIDYEEEKVTTLLNYVSELISPSSLAGQLLDNSMAVEGIYYIKNGYLSTAFQNKNALKLYSHFGRDNTNRKVYISEVCDEEYIQPIEDAIHGVNKNHLSNEVFYTRTYQDMKFNFRAKVTYLAEDDSTKLILIQVLKV